MQEGADRRATGKAMQQPGRGGPPRRLARRRRSGGRRGPFGSGGFAKDVFARRLGARLRRGGVQRRVAGDPPVLADGAGRAAGRAFEALAGLGRVNVRGAGRRVDDGDVGAARGQRVDAGLQRAADQVAEGAVLQLLDGRRADPGGVAGAGERDIQLAQVFAQALPVGQGQQGVVGGEGQLQPALRVVPLERQVGGLGGAEGAGEGQEDQRVFEALGLVDGDHLHQVGVALEAHLAGFAAGGFVAALLGQVADQGVLAVEQAAGLLEQLGQVQQVGEAALAAGAGGEQAGRHAEVVEQPAQHRQHALAAPAVAVGAELQHVVVPGELVVVEAVEPGPVEAEGLGGQRGAQGAAVVGLGAGGEPQLQVEGLGALEDGVLLRQVHAAHAPARQRAADGVGLAAVVHQHGEVGLTQGAQTVFAGKARLAALAEGEQARHFGGAHLGHGFEVGGLAHRLAVVGQRQTPDVEGRQRLATGLERVRAPVGVGREEGHRIALGAAEQEGARATLLCFGELEAAVGGPHHGVGRAEVAAQGVQPAGGGGAGGEVGVDVGAAEGVDGLLGVADEHQRSRRVVGLDPVDGVEDAVLDRVGVLELVDQRYRKLGADHLGQARAVGAGEGGVEAGEQVVEAHLGAARLLVGETGGDPLGRVAQDVEARVGEGREGGGHRVDGGEGRVLRGGQPRLPDLGQPLRGEPRPGGVGERGPDLLRVVAPGGEALQPAVVVVLLELGAVEGLLVAGGIEQGLEIVHPLAPRRLEGGQGLLLGLPRGIDHHRRVGTGGEQVRVVEQTFDLILQRLRRAPPAAHLAGGVGVQRVHEAAPVVAHHFGQQIGLVGLEALGEQAVAVEGVLAQHAVAPAVDGGHGGLVHPLGGQLQLAGAGGPALRRVGVAQLPEQRVGLGPASVRAEVGGGLGEAGADAVAQLLGGGVGEGDDEDLRWREGPGEGGPVVAVAQHQAQVEGGDGEGLAGAGAGLDEAAARKRETQGVKGGGGHAWSPAGAADLTKVAVNSGRSRVSARRANSPLAASASKLGQARRR